MTSKTWNRDKDDSVLVEMDMKMSKERYEATYGKWVFEVSVINTSGFVMGLYHGSVVKDKLKI